MTTLSCSSSCTDVRNPIKLSSGCSTESYLMRQRYLRSYPLKMAAKKKETLAGNVARRTKKWLKEKRRKHWRVGDEENDKQTWRPRGDKTAKANPGFFCVEACLKSLLGCVANVDVVCMENPKPTGFGTRN